MRCAENWQRRERWIEDRFGERGWSETEIERGKRSRRSGEYVIVGVLWCLLVLPAPICLALIVYAGYLRVQYERLGEEYVSARNELKRGFPRRSDEPRAGRPAGTA